MESKLGGQVIISSYERCTFIEEKSQFLRDNVLTVSLLTKCDL